MVDINRLRLLFRKHLEGNKGIEADKLSIGPLSLPELTDEENKILTRLRDEGKV